MTEDNSLEAADTLARRLLELIPGAPLGEQIALARLVEAELPAVAAEVALQLLERLDGRASASVFMMCAETLRVHGEARGLPRVRALRDRLPAFPGVRDWRADVDRAISVLETRQRGGCACVAMGAGGGAPDAAVFDVEVVAREPCLITMRASCRTCGRAFVVTEEEGYHCPTFRWQ
jgi:hypothetical protein